MNFFKVYLYNGLGLGFELQDYMKLDDDKDPTEIELRTMLCLNILCFRFLIGL